MTFKITHPIHTHTQAPASCDRVLKGWVSPHASCPLKDSYEDLHTFSVTGVTLSHYTSLKHKYSYIPSMALPETKVTLLLNLPPQNQSPSPFRGPSHSPQDCVQPLLWRSLPPTISPYHRCPSGGESSSLGSQPFLSQCSLQRVHTLSYTPATPRLRGLCPDTQRGVLLPWPLTPRS